MIKNSVIVDIDGCVNHYPNPLKMWAEVLLNLDQPESKQAIKKKNDFDLIKKTYRKSKILQYLLPREGIKDVFQKIKKSGCSITLLTARNPRKNPYIKKITVSWLGKYKIPFDSIVFTKNKYVYIKQNENRIIMVVEDEPESLNSFEKLKTKIVVFKNDLNENILHSRFHRVSSWEEIGGLFESWREK